MYTKTVLMTIFAGKPGLASCPLGNLTRGFGASSPEKMAVNTECVCKYSKLDARIKQISLKDSPKF